MKLIAVSVMTVILVKQQPLEGAIFLKNLQTASVTLCFSTISDNLPKYSVTENVFKHIYECCAIPCTLP